MSSRPFNVVIDKYLGMRQDVSPLVVSHREWVASNNYDERFGWPRVGYVLASSPPVELRSYWTYSRPDATLHEVWVDASGNIFENSAQVGSGVTLGTSSPSAAIGNGTIVIARGGSNKPWWRDTADGIWKSLDSAPYAFTVVGMMSAGPRLFGAPGGLGPDSVAWSAPADFTKWGAADTGGVEPIGMDAEAVSVILDGLQDDLAIYKKHSIWVIRGGNPTTWQIIRASSDIGSISPMGTVRIGRGHAFIHTSGIYLINSLGQVTWPPLTWKIQPEWDKIRTHTALAKVHIAYDNTEQTLWCWIPATTDTDLPFSRAMKVHLPTTSVSLQGIVAAASGYRQDSARVKYGRGTGVYDLTGTTDAGAAITSTFTTPIFAGDPYIPLPPHLEKRWGIRDQIFLLVDSRDSAALTMTVQPTIYGGDGGINLDPQYLSVAANVVSRIPLTLQPTRVGWGLQLAISVPSSNGGCRVLGILGHVEDITERGERSPSGVYR